MKSVWNSFKAAFAMFSKIPVPQADWSKENMKYMFCFFPFIGAVIGAFLINMCEYELSSGGLIEIWQYLIGAIFCITIIFFKGGIVGIIKDHAKDCKNKNDNKNKVERRELRNNS